MLFLVFFAVSKLEDGKSKLAPLDMNIYFEASAIKKANSSILLVRVNDDEWGEYRPLPKSVLRQNIVWIIFGVSYRKMCRF